MNTTKNNTKQVKNLSIVNTPNVLRSLGFNVKVFCKRIGHIRITLDFGSDYKVNHADYWCTTGKWVIFFDGEKVKGHRLENLLGELVDTFNAKI